jgi:hypothetical protein
LYCSSIFIQTRKLRTKDNSLPFFRINERKIPQSEIQRKRFEELDQVGFTKGRISSFIKRFLPRYKISFPYFKQYLKDKDVVVYFKRIYPYTFFENLDKYARRSKYYNADFINKVKEQVSKTKETFIKNILEGQALMSKSFDVRVSVDEHTFAIRRIFEDLFNCKTTT